MAGFRVIVAFFGTFLLSTVGVVDYPSLSFGMNLVCIRLLTLFAGETRSFACKGCSGSSWNDNACKSTRPGGLRGSTPGDCFASIRTKMYVGGRILSNCMRLDLYLINSSNSWHTVCPMSCRPETLLRCLQTTCLQAHLNVHLEYAPPCYLGIVEVQYRDLQRDSYAPDGEFRPFRLCFCSWHRVPRRSYGLQVFYHESNNSYGVV